MNKVATYLNEHISGEVITNGAELRNSETDGGVLAIRPEMIIKPAHINDIRKVMRFCTQLAEKGHILPVNVRGAATDGTGAAVSKGISIDMRSHMRHVVGIDPKQQLIHIQAGMSVATVNAILSTHKGMGLPNTSYVSEEGTVGGAIATAPAGIATGVRGFFVDKVQQAEIVLSNGDVIQTGRISKHELSKKKGLATFEGELYREVDNLITDNEKLLAQIDPDTPDTTGYSNLVKVKQKDGSFDLTPLFFGSQGSLGVVCEVIMKSDFVRPEYTVVAAAYSRLSDAQAAIDEALKAKAVVVELIDGRLLKQASSMGKKLEWAPEGCFDGAVALALFDDFSERMRVRSSKKLMKRLENSGALYLGDWSLESTKIFNLHSALELVSHPSGAHLITPKAFSGIWLPVAQMASFLNDLQLLEEKHGTKLPWFIDYTNGFVALYPSFDSKKISERQKILQLIAEVTQLVHGHNGVASGFGGDGRLKAAFTQKILTEDEVRLHEKVKELFDPLGILAPGVKTNVSVKELVVELNEWCKINNRA